MNDGILINTVPKEIIDMDSIIKVNVCGKGGKEGEIKNIFKNTSIINRVNKAIYDFEIEYEGEKYYIEIKKQEKHQWFDIAKYHNLSEKDKKVIILFVMHKEGIIKTIAAISLIDFINICSNDSATKVLGWNEEVIKTASEIKVKYPKLQFKVKAYINILISRYKESFDILYNNEGV